jgi:hypothetical protein
MPWPVDLYYDCYYYLHHHKMEVKMTIEDWKMIFKQANLRYKDVAVLLDCNYSKVSSWINGYSSPYPEWSQILDEIKSSVQKGE